VEAVEELKVEQVVVEDLVEDLVEVVQVGPVIRLRLLPVKETMVEDLLQVVAPQEVEEEVQVVQEQAEQGIQAFLGILGGQKDQADLHLLAVLL
jgi:hypothetical protein